MRILLTLAIFFLTSSFVFAQGNGTIVFSNSVMNKFQCNNQGWVPPKPNLIIFDGPCTPLQAMARDTEKVYTIPTSAEKCDDDMLAKYIFAGWEGKFEFVGCVKRV